MTPRKSHPKGIDPAYPQTNFVEAWYENHDMNYSDYMYPMYNASPTKEPKSSGYGHGIGQRAGKLRLSGMKNAHRIGKRK